VRDVTTDGSADQPVKPTTVLVVDDDSAVRLSLVMGLVIRNIDVLEAGNAEEAMGIFESHLAKIDVAVVDIVMPQVWGHELGSRLKAIQPELPIIYVSGHSHETLVARGILAVHDLYLGKPFLTSALAAKLEELLSGEGAGVLPDGSASAKA
jgi:DNA-binding response OmpR family regulator